MGNSRETMIPLFPCRSLADTLAFYRALGFAVTYEQTQPYLYGAVERGDVALNFARLTTHGAKGGFGACLVIVAAVGPYHRAVAEGLHAHYGQVPVNGLPRITRLQPGQTRFTLFDPSGNMLTYINRDEPAADYTWTGEGQSALIQALDNAAFLRDTYANDAAAAKALDKALAQHADATPLDRARALAVRAELAVALGDAGSVEAARAELRQIVLSDEERAAFDDALSAADRLERWIRGDGFDQPRSAG